MDDDEGLHTSHGHTVNEHDSRREVNVADDLDPGDEAQDDASEGTNDAQERVFAH